MNAGHLEDFVTTHHTLPTQTRTPHPDEANRLASACETHQDRLIVWTLLDTGLRVSELAGLTREYIDWYLGPVTT